MKFPLPPALVTVLWLTSASSAGAGPNNEAATAVPEPSLVLTIEEKALSAWASTKSAVGSFLSAFLPPSPAEFATRIGNHETEFWSLLADAGYRIKEVETSVGLVPGVSATFQIAREMSESDREFLERRLDGFAKRDGSVVARLQRSIINVLLEAAETEVYRIETLDVVMLPLPKARFVLTPTDRLYDGDHQSILRAIDTLKRHAS
ncbi:MAG: hypothetical protein H7841_02450 [Magnetospirillum sp. WYHS-4]